MRVKDKKLSPLLAILITVVLSLLVVFGLRF